MSSKCAFVLLALAAVNLPAQTLRLFEAVEPHMGTLFRIEVYAEDESRASAGFRSAFARVTQLDEMLSDYRSDSELSRVTQSPAGQAVPVSLDLFRVLRAAQEIAERTGGGFDVTLGPLTHLWRAARKSATLPRTTDLEEARQRCGFRKLHLDSKARTVTFDRPNMQLDAGGIAKGYAADEAIVTLREAGITRALVAASGDLAFSDAPPGKPGWRIGVDSFDDAGQPFTRVLLLANAAVSTSGDTEQYWESEGKRYSHIIDPKTGAALTNRLPVTVVARSGMEADAAATAVSVLGEERGLAFVKERPGMSAFILDRARATATN